MDGLPLDVSPLGDEGAQMITLVETSVLEEDGPQPPNVHILTAHQVGIWNTISILNIHNNWVSE